jgi:hypothetical protein
VDEDFKRGGYIAGFILIADLGIVASFVCPMIVYVIPGYLYYKACCLLGLDEYYEWSCVNIRVSKKYLGLAFAVFGIILMILYTAFTCYLLSFENKLAMIISHISEKK